MSEKLKNARLVLNTSLFYPNGTGTVLGSGTMDPRFGNADASRLNCTFISLDWMMILGDLYDEYDSFSLVIESVSYVAGGGTPFANMINVTASGLDWQDQTYDILTKSKGSGCIIYSGTLYGTAVPQSEGFIFRKPQRFRDLTLTITNPSTGTQAGTFDRPASLVYAIKIFGVDSSKVKHISAYNNSLYKSY